jgi:putative transcriptional regulator
MAEVTNNLRRRRFDHNEMTQEDLANRVGVSRQTIIAIESGRYTPSLGLAFRLVRIFKCRIEDLFTFKE